MMKAKLLTLIFGLALSMTAQVSFAHQAGTAEDDFEGTEYIPTGAEVLSSSSGEGKELKALAAQFVRALEGRNRSATEKLVTPEFVKETEVFADFGSYQSRLNLVNFEIRHLRVIRYKGDLLMRFTVYDPSTKKEDEMAARSWYEVRKVGSSWKMHGYRSQYEPDME